MVVERSMPRAVAVALACSVPLMAAAATRSLGELSIRYDPTPVAMGAGQMVWSGQTSVPLTLDDATGRIKGTAAFPFRNTAQAGVCTSVCNGTSKITITGTVSGDVYALRGTAPQTVTQCTVRCPKGGAVATKRTQGRQTLDVEVPIDGEQPVRVQPAGGPGLFFQVVQPCPPDPAKADTFSFKTRPADSKWAVTRLTMLTLQDVRSAGQPNPRRFGYTSHAFHPELTVTGSTAPTRSGGGVCFWVTDVAYAFEPIEVGLPGLDYGPQTCEFKAASQHEQKHVSLYKGLLSNLARDLSRATQTAGLPTAARPRRYKSKDAGESAARQKIERVTDAIFTAAVDARIARDRALDSDAEYAAVKAQCPGGWR